MKTFIFTLLSLFVTAAHATDLSGYDKLDPHNNIPDSALKQALTYFDAHKGEFKNQNYMAVIDFTENSAEERMHIVNLKTGAVENHLTSHGRGSDPKKTGMARNFSNKSGSNMTSLGFYRTGGTYYGKHGLSLKLQGLSSTNSNAMARKIVIHAAPYISEKARHAGRSEGCMAVDPKVITDVINKMKNGALIYNWAGN